MTAPASYSRILALLKRVSPSWPSLDADKSTGKEMGSIAVALAMAADAVDALFDEIFPDTTSVLLPRWEGITRNPVRVGDDDSVRQARVLAVLRRVSGARIDQLENMLLSVLDCDASDLIWVEGLRGEVELLFTETTGAISATIPATVLIGKPWPGVVDDAGVQVYIAYSGAPTGVTVTAPDRTVWTFTPTASGWYFTRDVFTGKAAGGTWTIAVAGTGTLTEARIVVSNDVDSGSIYQFFVFRDPGIAGTADLVEAQRLFKRTALGNMQSRVVETLAFETDDPHSLTDRDPLGV